MLASEPRVWDIYRRLVICDSLSLSFLLVFSLGCAMEGLSVHVGEFKSVPFLASQEGKYHVYRFHGALTMARHNHIRERRRTALLTGGDGHLGEKEEVRCSITVWIAEEPAASRSVSVVSERSHPSGKHAAS